MNGKNRRSPLALAAHRMRGITLIELMIVVVVVSILAAVAYPNYREFAARAKRNEAKAALLKSATNQERFYLQNNTYTTDMVALGFPVADNYITDSESYNVRVTAANAVNFTATATFRLGGGEENKCNLFQIDGRGTRTSDPYTDCWTRTQ
jgi:type IV pilus assembly protein PilE